MTDLEIVTATINAGDDMALIGLADEMESHGHPLVRQIRAIVNDSIGLSRHGMVRPESGVSNGWATWHLYSRTTPDNALPWFLFDSLPRHKHVVLRHSTQEGRMCAITYDTRASAWLALAEALKTSGTVL